MKNKSTGTGDSRRKGFYAALSAGIGAVLVLALVISFSNLTTIGPDPQQLVYEPDLFEDTIPAGYDHTLPYLAQTDMDQALFRPRITPMPAPERPEEPAAPAAPVAPATAPRELPSQPTQDTAPETDVEAAGTTAPARQDTPETAPEAAPEAPAANEQATFEPFTEYGELVWPTYGDIAMIFSQDRLIYNPTLDQWRTNDDLRISASEGTPVRAAAAGKVVEVGNDRVYGNFVRIDNGNGWETILGQLMDGILVVEGDIVQTGQVIGGVGRPSVFSVLNGHHVSMRVLHENNLVDPKLLLADIEQ